MNLKMCPNLTGSVCIFVATATFVMQHCHPWPHWAINSSQLFEHNSNFFCGGVNALDMLHKRRDPPRAQSTLKHAQP